MANDDLLQQIDKLIQKRLDAQDQKFQKRLEENNKQIRKEIKAEIDPLHERMDAQYKNLSGQISATKTEITHDVANLVSDTLIPMFDEQEAKIKELQKAVGLRPKH